MTNMPNLSTRAKAALDILADGGQFKYALERNSYTGREQFQWRLLAARGGRVPGIGGAAFHELEDKGFAFRRVANGFMGSSSSYYLNNAA